MDGSEPRFRPDTRQRLLDLAEDAVLAKGFGASSVEELAAQVEPPAALAAAPEKSPWRAAPETLPRQGNGYDDRLTLSNLDRE